MADTDDLNRRYDPMTRDELIAECERQRARAGEAEAVLGHNMALANATTRRAMNERNGIIRKMRERYSAAEIADMAGLTRQRVHQILNEAPVESSADVPDDGKCWIKGCQQPRGHVGFCDPLPPCDSFVSHRYGDDSLCAKCGRPDTKHSTRNREHE